MKLLSHVLSVVAWVTAIVIAWTERRTTQAQPAPSRTSPDPEAAQAGEEQRGGSERAASSASQTAAPLAAAFDFGPPPALTDMPCSVESAQPPTGDVDTVTDDVGILAVRDPANDPEVEEILATSSFKDNETSRLPARPEGGAPNAASAVVSEGGAAAPNDAASTDGEEAGPVNSVPGTGTATCPDGYPVKGNASSRIYHLPGESSYDRTVPEICFATAEDAAAAGFRPRKH